MHCAASERLKPHIPLIRFHVSVCRKSVPHNVECDDLFQAGLIAVHQSLDKYDPARGASLRTFLSLRIRGAIIDELRAQDWLSRSERRNVEKGAGVVLSLEELGDFHLLLATELGDEPPDKLEVKQRARLVLKAIARLDENEKELLELLYDKEVLSSDIAKMQGVSGAMITLRHKNLIDRLIDKVNQINLDAIVRGEFVSRVQARPKSYSNQRFG